MEFVILNPIPQGINFIIFISAHPNLRIFITHGGLLSTTETIFFGVPTIVMPYGADQNLNAVRAVKKGYALKVDLSYSMADDLKIAMNEMLSNSKYVHLSSFYTPSHDSLTDGHRSLKMKSN